MVRHSPGPIAALRVAACALMLCAPLSAHDTHVVGRYRLTIGWADEPAYTGSRNAVTVTVSDSGGNPVVDLGGGSLAVEVSFGPERTTLALQPAWARRHEYRAWIVPTRPGTYTFHVTGRITDQTVDISATCSDKTFDCVADDSDLQFPSKDPSAAELAMRVERSMPRAEQALASAEQAKRLALAALGGAGVAVVAAIALGLRRGRRIE